MRWDEEAKKALSRVPFFIRAKVKRRVEEEARRAGAEVVRLEHLLASRRRFLEGMEQGVKGYRVETCFGSTGCPNRTVDESPVEELERLLEAKGLKAFLRERVEGPLRIHHELSISISDCPNACSRPQIADIGLIGAREPRISDEPCNLCEACLRVCEEEAISLGDEGPTIDRSRCLYCGGCIKACITGTIQEGLRGYRNVVGGKLGRHPRLGTDTGRIFPAQEAATVVERCVDYYLAHSQRGERLGEILEHRGVEDLLEAIRSVSVQHR